jgi:hypothetical protein
MSIIHITDDIKKEFRIQADGKGFVSIRGAARIVGVNQKTLTDYFNGEGVTPLIMAEKLSELGFKGEGVKLFAKAGIPDIALSAIVEYYAMYAAENCTDQAKSALSAFNAIGIRFWIQSELGFQQQIARREQLHIHDLDVLQLEFLANCCFLRDEDLPAAMKDYIPEAFWFLRKEGVLLEHLVDRHRELHEKRKLEVEAQNWMAVVHQAEAMRNGAFKKGIFWEPNLPELVEQQAVETIAQNKARIEIRQKEFQKKSQNKKYMFQVAEFQEQIDRNSIAIAARQKRLLK